MSEVSDSDFYPWSVVHGSLEAERPAMVETLYCDRDPYGEYVFYAASDPEALRDGKISVLNYAYLAEARVTFEADLVATGASDIDWCREDAAEQGEAFVSEIWPSWQDATLGLVADSIFPAGQDFVMARSVLSVDSDSAAWVEVTRIDANEPAEIALTFCCMQEDRLIEIKAVLKDQNVPVYVLADKWAMLVARFKDLPYERLSGAKRIEPEPDAFDEL